MDLVMVLQSSRTVQGTVLMMSVTVTSLCLDSYFGHSSVLISRDSSEAHSLRPSSSFSFHVCSITHSPMISKHNHKVV